MKERKLPKTQTMPRRNSTSEFIGVSWDRPRKLWIATIYLDGNTCYLGGFKYEHEAALVRDYYSRKYFGTKAVCNFQYTVSELPQSSDKRPHSEYGKYIYQRWKRYVVQINTRVLKRHLGVFLTLEEAIVVRDEFCKKHNLNPYKY